MRMNLIENHPFKLMEGIIEEVDEFNYFGNIIAKENWLHKEIGKKNK